MPKVLEHSKGLFSTSYIPLNNDKNTNGVSEDDTPIYSLKKANKKSLDENDDEKKSSEDDDEENYFLNMIKGK